MFTISAKKEIEVCVCYLVVDVPLDEVKMQVEDAKGHNGRFVFMIDLNSGTIEDWLLGKVETCWKVQDSGIYTLLDDVGKTVARLHRDYVPHGVLNGEYGDYIELDIDADGKILNFGNPDFSDFIDEDGFLRG